MILCFLLLLTACSTDAALRFDNSVLYDQYDFEGVAEVSTNICLSGCKVYAAIAYSNNAATQGIIIADPVANRNTSVTTLSTYHPNDSQDKGFLEIGNTPALTIYNVNPNLESAPLTIWIVSANAAHYSTAEVYDPSSTVRPRGPAPNPLTFISALPFTVILNAEDENALSMKYTGYDAIDINDSNGCYLAMDESIPANSGIFIYVNGPLASVQFDSVKFPGAVLGVIDGAAQFFLTRSMAQPQFISSAGFVCGSEKVPQVYRSSIYAATLEYVLNAPENTEITFYFDMYISADKQTPVHIYTPDGTDFELNGNAPADKATISLIKRTTQAIVKFTPGESGGFFAMKVRADNAVELTTPKGVEGTTSSSSSLSLALTPFVIACLAR